MSNLSLPEAFVERLHRLYGQIPEAYLKAPSQVAFRVNTLKGDEAVVCQSLRQAGLTFEAVSWLPGAYLIPAALREKLMQSQPYQSGQVYLQNLSSMLPAVILDPQPGEEILDLTAAPGSKTSQMAALMNNTGRIAAVERSASRYHKLQSNLFGLGVTNTETYRRDGVHLWRACPERFDRVLLDAPCSSEAHLRAWDPAHCQTWSLKKIKHCARLQKQLLHSALGCLKPGGVLVYATCSLAPEENEAMVDYVRRKFGAALQLQAIDLDVPGRVPACQEWEGRAFEEASLCLRIKPSDPMAGFFVAKWVKASGSV